MSAWTLMLKSAPPRDTGGAQFKRNNIQASIHCHIANLDLAQAWSRRYRGVPRATPRSVPDYLQYPTLRAPQLL